MTQTDPKEFVTKIIRMKMDAAKRNEEVITTNMELSEDYRHTNGLQWRNIYNEWAKVMCLYTGTFDGEDANV